MTPAFRDFTPGEYVFQTSDALRTAGWNRVLTAPGMVAPYYERLGFRRDGDRFAFDLPSA